MSDPANPPAITTDAVDLSDLRLMPSWVANFGKEAPAKQRYADEAGDDRGQRGGGRGDRFAKGGRPGGERRFGNDRGGERRDRFGKSGGGAGGPPRERREGGGAGFGKGGGGGRFERRGPRGDRRGERDRFAERPERAPLPVDVTVSIEADERAVEMLAAHIRSMGRAFSMFDASRLVLADGARFHARFRCADERQTGFFQVPGDSAIFLTREEAVAHILNSGALSEYYRAEDIELEAPKGNFQSVGVCGMSGALLGPPSHHSYQAAILRVHRERFANVPLEDYKRRVRVESNPELVEKWKEQQKKGTRWVCLKDAPVEGQEPKAFSSRAEVEAHFRRAHSDGAVIEVREAVLPGNVSRESLSHVLLILLRKAVDHARNHLFDFSQRLGHGLEHRGLKLFKRRSGKLFVSRVRPRSIDPGTVFSERVTKIVEVIKAQPGIMLSKLVEAAAPAAGASQEIAPPLEAPPAAEGAPSGAPESPSDETPVPQAPASGDAPKLSDDQVAVLKDLRWLADEGYIIEYSDGAVFLGVQGEKSVEPDKKPEPAAEGVAEAEPTSEPAAAAPVSDTPGEGAATESPHGSAEVDDQASEGQTATSQANG